jgi:hypothetical protein
MNGIISKIRVWSIWRKNKFSPVFRPRRRKIRTDDKALRRRRSYFRKIAALGAPVVIIFLLPVHAAALDQAVTSLIVTHPAITPPAVETLQYLTAVETLQSSPETVPMLAAVAGFPSAAVMVTAIDDDFKLDDNESSTDSRTAYSDVENYAGEYAPRARGASHPARIAVIMACAGGITLAMLIRRRV